MGRKLYRIELVEYFYEYYDHGIASKTQKGWVTDSEYIVEMRSAMKQGNFYRCYLNSGRETILTESTIITLEMY